MLLARLFVPFVAAELRTAVSGQEDDGWVDQTCSPLGRRLHCALARNGTLSARKVGRRWLVRRADVDAYIVQHGRAAEAADSATELGKDADEAEIRALLAECGMVAAAPEPKSKATKPSRSKVALPR